MINVKPEVSSGLLANTTLTGLLGGSKVEAGQKATNPYPCITFWELTNFGASYADDREMVSEIHLQVDVWSKSDPTAIADEVDKTMGELGFIRTAAADLYESDTKIYHKAMRFKIKKEVS